MDTFNFSDLLKSGGFTGIINSEILGKGISFKYGEAGNSEWEDNFTLQSVAVSNADKYDETKVIYKHKETGLSTIIRFKNYKDYGVIEYKIEFVNDSDRKLPVLTDIDCADFVLDLNESGEPVIHNLNSGACPWIYPPAGYKHKTIEIYPELLNPRGVPYWNGEIEFSNKRINEKNSYKSGDLPLVYIQDRAEKSGIYLAVGWEGDWSIKISKYSSELKYTIRSRVRGVNIALYPSEKIECPSIFLGQYEGDQFKGSDALRRFIEDILMADCAIKDGLAPVSYDHWFGYKLDIDDKLMYDLADKSAQAGVENFLIDAGWYPGTQNVPGGYMRGTGNWSVNYEKFPDGLKAVSDYVHEKGMKFGIWIAPEKMWETSEVAQKYPELILSLPEEKAQILDLSKKEARKLYKEILAKAIEEYGLDLIRIEPLVGKYRYFQASEKPDRQGALQLHYIQGLYEVWSWLRESYPNIIIELLAPTMINMDLIRYADIMLLSDMNMNPNVVRPQFDGLNRMVPGGHVNGMFVPSTLDYERYPDYYYHSFFAGSLQISDPISQWSNEMLDDLKRHITAYKKIRYLLNRNYYLPFGDLKRMDEWQGWQFYDYECSEGVLIAFRLRSPQEKQAVILRGIDKDAKYEIKDVYRDEKIEMDGSKLIECGLDIAAQEFGSKVLYYSKI
jgi:alpha-galactosidase